MALTVSQLARLAGVSVRTLHHYDEIGLLRPSARSEAGYRLYTHTDLERLQQVLFFRELDFPLEEISRIVGDPKFDVVGALRMQRQLLTEKAVRLHAVIEAVEAALAARETGMKLTKEEMFEVFGEFDPTKHEAEAEQRWGDSDAWRESKRRTARYGKREWAEFKAEAERVTLGLAALLERGARADSEAAMDLAEDARKQIDRWFYPCSHQFHCGLAEMYIADSRFTESYDRVRPGLAQFVHDAIFANAARHGGRD